METIIVGAVVIIIGTMYSFGMAYVDSSFVICLSIAAVFFSSYDFFTSVNGKSESRKLAYGIMIAIPIILYFTPVFNIFNERGLEMVGNFLALFGFGLTLVFAGMKSRIEAKKPSK